MQIRGYYCSYLRLYSFCESYISPLNYLIMMKIKVDLDEGGSDLFLPKEGLGAMDLGADLCRFWSKSSFSLYFSL